MLIGAKNLFDEGMKLLKAAKTAPQAADSNVTLQFRRFWLEDVVAILRLAARADQKSAYKQGLSRTPPRKDVPLNVWVRIVDGRIVETFTSVQQMNASTEQDDIFGYVLEE